METTTDGVRVSSVTPDKAAAAAAGQPTAPGTVAMPDPPRPWRPPRPERIETYEATRPDGRKVEVNRNVETGQTTVEEVTADGPEQ